MGLVGGARGYSFSTHTLETPRFGLFMNPEGLVLLLLLLYSSSLAPVCISSVSHKGADRA